MSNTVHAAEHEVFKAGYLPGLQDGEVRWKRLPLGTPNDALTVEVPELSTDQYKALASRIRPASRAHRR